MTSTLDKIKASARDLQSLDPVLRAKAEEIKRRYQSGMFNHELQAEGAKPVSIKKPNFEAVDMSAFDAIKQETDVTTKAPSAPVIADVGSDAMQTAQNIGTTISEGAQKIQDIAGNEDFNIAQKSMGILGSLMGTGAKTIGDVTTGVGKAVLTQDAEDQLKTFVEEKAKGLADTEVFKGMANWYGNLTPEDKLIVDSAGGFVALVSELAGAGTAGKVATPLKEGLATATETAMSAVPKVVDQTVDTVSDIFKTSQKSLEGKVQSTFEKGVKPNLQSYKTIGEAEKYRQAIVDGAKTIVKNKDQIQFLDEAGQPITGKTPESLQQFTEAIDQTKKSIYAQYDNLATQAGENGVKVDAIKIANELDQVINNKALKLSNPEAVAYAQAVRDRFIKAGEIDAKTAQDIIQNYNSSLQAFYRNPTPEGLTKSAVDALMANQMREALDKGIEGLTGAQYQALKTQYASLKTIERDVLRATLRDARKNAKGLIDYIDIFSGGQLVTGLLTLNPGAIATGAAQKGFAEWFKFLNNPNRAVKNMFESASKLDQEAGSVPISGRKQLNAPEAGASDASIYAPLELGARTDTTIDAANFSKTKPPEQSPKLPVRPLLNAPGDNPIELKPSSFNTGETPKLGQAKITDPTQFERAKGLSPEKQTLEDKAFKYVQENEEAILKEYFAKNGNYINADDFRPLFKGVGYTDGRLAAGVQEPSSYLAKRARSVALQNPGEYVVATAGGSGVGKTSAVKAIPQMAEKQKNAAMVLDSNFSSIKSAHAFMQEAKAAGKEVDVIYTYRDFLDSIENGVIKRMLMNKSEMGRLVPSKVVAANHKGSFDVIEQLQKDGANVFFIDNSLGDGSSKVVSLSDIKNKAKYPSEQELTRIANEKIKELYETKKPFVDKKTGKTYTISSEQYQSLVE